MIWFMILLLISVLINVVMVCVAKSMSEKKKIQKAVKFTKPVNKTKVRFTLEDLPFHQQRFYIEGENTYSKPWSVNDSTKKNISKILKSSGYSSLEYYE